MRKGIKVLFWLAVLVAVFSLLKTAYRYVIDEYFPLKYEDTIKTCAEEQEIPEELVMAVINAESGFDEMAHSGVAKGLMQLTDSTAKWICDKTGDTYYEDMAYNPEANIKMGCWYLKYLIDRYDNVDTALAAYNAGLGNVDIWLGDKGYSSDGKNIDKIPFPETEKYVSRVRWMMWVYKNAY